MEFLFYDFQGRLVLNATDIILHLEESKTARLYEQTFFDRDFSEVAQLGGLEFVSKLLQSVFWKEKNQPGLSVSITKQTPSEVSLLIRYTLPLLVKPIELALSLPAIRRQTGGADLQELDRKLKETVISVSEIEPKFTVMQKTFETLLSHIKELEERTEDYIVLPGCDFAIPTSLTSIKLVRSGTATLDNFYYSVAYPQMKCQAISGNNIVLNPFNPNYSNWQNDPGSFAMHDCQLQMRNIKHLHKLRSLTIAGISVNNSEIAILESLQNLTHLTIIGGRVVNFTGYPGQSGMTSNQNVANGNFPTITHLNWIKSLKNLQSLVLVGCRSLTDITALKDLPNLRELDIRETNIKNTDFLINSNLKITK